MRYTDSRADPRINVQSGFTFIEVMVALATTTIVLAAVFSLLARGLSSTPAELERADVQAQARNALGQISRDVSMAGVDLPPEFPAFTPPGVNPDLAYEMPDVVDSSYDPGPNAIEIVGNLGGINSGGEPVRVLQVSDLDGLLTVTLDAVPTRIEKGDLVLIYDDKPQRGTWMFGLVSSVDLGLDDPTVTLKTMAGEQEGDTILPSFISNYNRPLPSSGYLTPVTVITYTTGSAAADPMASEPDGELVLRRQVNWGEPVPVAYVEDLQIRYFVAATIDDIDPTMDGPTGEEKLGRPPIPQPDPAEPLQLDGLVRGVHITVTSRSHQANLLGSTEDGFLRSTYSTRVATRNLLMGLYTRMNLEGFN